MGILTTPVQYSRKQWAYMCWHKGWRNTLPGVTGTRLVYKRVGVDDEESGLNSGKYRPKSENAAYGAGPDLGAQQWNTELSRVRYLHDPFTMFHPLEAIEQSLAQAFFEWQSPFARWSYPGKKTDISIKLAEVEAEIGPEEGIYDMANSPFWLMVRNGVDPQDLPVPPPNVYSSELPPAPRRINSVSPENTALQRWLAVNHWYSAVPVLYYGTNTALGVAKVQMFVRDLGLWTGPVDGREWSVALRDLIDDMLRFDFETLWS